MTKDYFEITGNAKATTREIATWELQTNRWEAPSDLIIQKCREDIARAMREEYIAGPDGKPVRAKHAARVSEGDTQTTFWADNSVAEIEGFVQQQIKDATHELAVLENAIRCMEDLAQRANFEVFLKKFLQSMYIILPNAEAFPYRIPAKRFRFLLVKIKERYKDDSLSITGAGEKVRKLTDEHLVSLGINPRIPPVELLSPDFMTK